MLADALSTVSDPIRLSETIEAAPVELIHAAKALGFEGIVAKKKGAIYESGKRSGAWVKYRVNRVQEFVIGGYVPGNPLDSILVGHYQGGKLMYAGKVKNGFVPCTRQEVYRRSVDGLNANVVAQLPIGNGMAEQQADENPIGRGRCGGSLGQFVDTAVFPDYGGLGYADGPKGLVSR